MSGVSSDSNGENRRVNHLHYIHSIPIDPIAGERFLSLCPPLSSFPARQSPPCTRFSDENGDETSLPKIFKPRSSLRSPPDSVIEWVNFNIRIDKYSAIAKLLPPSASLPGKITAC